MAMASATWPRLLPLGDGAWTVEFGDHIDPVLNGCVMALAHELSALRPEDPVLAPITDLVPTFRSLTVHFDPLQADAQALGQRLMGLAALAQPQAHQGRQWLLPVCFDTEFAPDLPALATARGLPPDEVMAQLLQARFRVYMTGFLPGFPYMGGLPPVLATPRLATPRARVPAQSVAVAGEMCAVYPWDSPGGWHLLGRTPVVLFDLRHEAQPAMLAAGDSVRWRTVTRAEYDALWQCSQRGELDRANFECQEGEA